ncbi:MAG: hypothetical protein ACHQ3O_04725 [Candidatus Limnocylindria bacterium]|jgi:hypothetical protein
MSPLRVGIAIATATWLGFGVAAALRVVGPERVAGGAAAPIPLRYDDYALQFYYGQLGAQLLAETGVNYGYDPNFLAGYPKLPLYYPSSRPFELAFRWFESADPALVFNRSVLALLASLPFCLLAAALLWRAPDAERLVIVVLGSVPHLLVPAADFYGYMEASGMVSFLFASFVSLPLVAAGSRYLSSGGVGAALAMAATGCLLFVSHPSAPLLVAAPAVVLAAGSLRGIPLARAFGLALVVVVVAGVSWPWYEGQLVLGHHADLRDFYTPGGTRHFAPAGGWLAPLRVSIPAPMGLALLPAVFGPLGLVLWWREGERRRCVLFAVQIALLFTLSFYGVALGLAALAPGRFTLPLSLWLLFPAAHGGAFALLAVHRRLTARLGTRGPAAAGGLLAIAVALALFAGAPPTALLRPYTLPQLERDAGTDTKGPALLDWLRDQTDSEGRILHEETDRLSHRYYGSHLAALMPLHTGRLLAGGPAPHALLVENSLRFIAGTLRGRPVSGWGDDDLHPLLALYNVRYVLCWSAPARRRLTNLAGATPVGVYDVFELFRLETPPSWFLQGSGRLEVRGRRIALSELAPEGGAVAIKFHWLETLRTDPPRTLEPFPVEGEPAPFLRVLDPPESLVIYDAPRSEPESQPTGDS